MSPSMEKLYIIYYHNFMVTYHIVFLSQYHFSQWSLLLYSWYRMSDQSCYSRFQLGILHICHCSEDSGNDQLDKLKVEDLQQSCKMMWKKSKLDENETSWLWKYLFYLLNWMNFLIQIQKNNWIKVNNSYILVRFFISYRRQFCCH